MIQNKIIMSSLMLLFFGQLYSQPETHNNIEVIYDRTEKEASYPNLNKYLMNNLRYPLGTDGKSINGSCKVQFIVHKDGKTSDFIVLEGVEGCPTCDQEALRVLKNSKKWIPAVVDGKNVSSKHIEIIKFNLQ